MIIKYKTLAKECPVRDKMLVEDAKPHGAPHPVRDATTGFLNPYLTSSIPSGFPKAPLIENGRTPSITLIKNKVIRGDDEGACPVLRGLSKIRVYSSSAVNLVRDETTGFDSCVPNGTPERVNVRSFYPHPIPNGIGYRTIKLNNSIQMYCIDPAPKLNDKTKNNDI